MKRLIVIVSCVALVSVFSNASDLKLWGKQIAGWGAKNAQTEGNALVLKKTATIKSVSGTAKRYCIWSGGHSVLCASKGKSIIGKSLSPGRYTVLPGLIDGKTSSDISIILQ